MKTPESIVQHAARFNDNAWKQYTPAELGDFVHLLIKRSAHRTEPAKRTKDIDDAQNYLNMLQAHVDAARA